MYKCKYCGKEFETPASLAAHVSMCKQSPNYEANMEKRSKNRKGKSTVTEKMISEHPEKYIKKDFEITCPKCGTQFIVNCTQNDFDKGKYRHYCSRSCANSRNITDDIKSKISLGVKNSSEFYASCLKNRKYPLTDKICPICNKTFSYKEKLLLPSGRLSNSLFCSLECRSIYYSNKLLKTGGFREGSVKHYKYGTYAGIYCDSSWELAYILYCKDNNISILRNKKSLNYIDNDGIQHKFYPDFLINGIELIEIKGRQDPMYTLKMALNPIVKFLFKEDMKPILKYVTEKYGNEFWNLYEK